MPYLCRTLVVISANNNSIMFSAITIPAFSYSQEYFYGLSLFVAAVVNLVLAGLLLFDPNNYLYTETPRYLRSRRLTGLALAVFGVGFLLHWLFMPHFTHLLAGKALSFSYFHIGGVLFSMSHTSLIDRHYFTRRIVVRDISLLLFSLIIYWLSAWLANPTLTYLGSALFFLHIGYLTWTFYNRFYHIYQQLGNYAEYLPNDIDKEVLWLHYSCHLIIAFGIGGMLCTVLFHDSTTPFTILLFVGILVFAYIYKTLDNFSIIVSEADDYLLKSEEYLQTEEGRQEMLRFKHQQDHGDDSPSPLPSDTSDEVRERIERWVAERHYTDDTITFRDAVNQMGISSKSLTYYLESQVKPRSYRQWLAFLRVEEAKRLMVECPQYTLDYVAQLCGYANRSNLTRTFKALEGVPPFEWLKANKRKHDR